MKNKHKPLIIALVLFGLLFSSCGENGNFENGGLTSPVPQASKSLVVPTSSTTPTGANKPTVTGTPTSVAIPSTYNFPLWMKNEDNVLMIVTGITDTTNQLSFINASTGEQFQIIVPLAEVRGYFWTPDGTGFGFLSSDNRNIYLVNTTSGVVSELPVIQQSIILLNPENVNKHKLESLKVFGSFANNNVLFYYCRLCYSYDFTYTILQDYPNGQNAESQISVKNVFTQEEIILTQANDFVYDLETVWSPTKPEVAILQSTEPNYPDFGTVFKRGNRITIYNVITDQIVKTYLGDFANIRWNWSPVGQQILYTHFSESLDYVGTRPCILYLDTGQSKCIKNLENAKLIAFSNFEWSNNGTNVYYTTYAHNPHRSDLCIYDLQDGFSHCPTEGISDLDILNVEGYVSSPDGQYFLVSYGNSCSTCDYWGEPSIAIVQNEGRDIIPVGKQAFIELGNDSIFYPAIYDALWRPTLKP